MPPVNFTADADELRRQEFARLSAAVTPRIEAFRSMTGDAFRTEIALMLERLGHTVISSVGDIVTTKEGRKYVTACATPTEQTATKTPALRRLHSAIIAGNAARAFYVTPRGFTPEADHYAATSPIDLVDGRLLIRSMHRSRKGMLLPASYKAMCCQCGELVAHRLEADIDAAAGAVEETARIVAQIRARWPEIRIVLRADSGFAREALMSWCEANGVDYLFGLAKNKRLVAEITADLAAAEVDSKATGQPARRFKEFSWSTRDSWSRHRRVIAKAEWTGGAANPRFVVTSLCGEEAAPQRLYEEIYCARGDMENRIKECQLDLFADRTSAATMRANQLRLWFASIAYVLLCALRRIALQQTQFAKATCGTIRLKLLKIGALVRTGVRRIKFAMASGCPYQRDFARAHAQLINAATR
jgi:Transposase DDE domain group 1/Restriction endonuclease